MSFPVPPFTHLHRLTDSGGLYEHAEGIVPRREHGYCLDDVARALVAVNREAESGCADNMLLVQYFDFVLDSQAEDGRFRNRKSADLVWQAEPSVEDCWGRGAWALGATVSGYAEQPLRDRALLAFERAATWRSPWSRAMAFAGLGAADVLAVMPKNASARTLLRDVANRIGGDRSALQIGGDRSALHWPWPEPRLTYANAVLPEVLIAAGAALIDTALVDRGLRMLGWLLDLETRDGHLSVTPVGGRGRGDEDCAGFDQQPIEVAAMADACARAYAVTGDERWAEGVRLAASWFFGATDSRVVMYDSDSGGSCDGLEREGRNDNQGAESTLALITTLQQARRLTVRSL